jgi:transposase
MNALVLLPDPEILHLESIILATNLMILVLQTSGPEALCPTCGQPSRRVHSRYGRTLADLPCFGLSVRLRLTCRKFFCDRPDCSRRIFTERLPSLARRYARRTERLGQVLLQVGHALGGEAGARLATTLGIDASPDTLLRWLRHAPPQFVGTPRVLGVDDWAFSRGQRYGTLLVDLERGVPVDLLPDRQSETLAAWLKAHPGVQIVTRDRSTEYARGIREGAPDAVQVTDRFHLLSNLREMLERTIDRNRHLLQGIVLPTVSTEQGDPAAEKDAIARSRQPAKRSSLEQATRQARYQQRLALRQQVHALYEEGESILGIARRLQLNRGTVYRYLRGQPESAAIRTRHVGSVLDAFLPYLCQRWAEGCHNGKQLWRELRERGYRGSRKMVAVWAQQQREAPAPSTPKKYLADPQVSPVPDRRSASTPSPRLPSSRRTSWLLLREPDTLSPVEEGTLAAILAAAPELAAIQPLVQQFHRLVKERDAAGFGAWRERALSSELPSCTVSSQAWTETKQP